LNFYSRIFNQDGDIEFNIDVKIGPKKKENIRHSNYEDRLMFYNQTTNFTESFPWNTKNESLSSITPNRFENISSIKVMKPNNSFNSDLNLQEIGSVTSTSEVKNIVSINSTSLTNPPSPNHTLAKLTSSVMVTTQLMKTE